MAGLDIRAVQYNKKETADYQIRQSPTESTLSSPDWDEVFSGLHYSRPIVQRRRPGQGAAHFVWKIDPPAQLKGAYVAYDEFGYDGDGYICKLMPEAERDDELEGETDHVGSCRDIEEHIVSCRISSFSSSGPPGYRWSGQRFGREWKFGLNGICDETLFSIAALQLCRDADMDKNGPLGLSRQGLAKCFLAQFRDTWSPSQKLWGTSDKRWANSARFDKMKGEDVVFQYHMRTFTAPSWWPRPPGSGVRRVSGPLPSNRYKPNPGDDAAQRVSELRYSVGLKTTWRLDLPVFTLVTMADSDTASHLEALVKISDRNEWEAVSIHPSIRATGMAAFAFRIRSLLPHWERQWSNLIDEIGKALNNDILRAAAEWIRDSMDDLRRTVDDMERLYLAKTAGQGATFLPQNSDKDARDAAVAMFRRNWDSVLSEQKRIGENLLRRIATKQEETKNLRDGLFNATSVSEVKNSTQLNRYILIFTTVTIFYLPLSFITLGLFDWRDRTQVAWSAVTIVLVAGITYLFSGISMWLASGPASGPKVGVTGRSGPSYRYVLDTVRAVLSRGRKPSEYRDVEMGG
ncbi:hypothetical protein QBC34DRAFT_297065 [Podospora aff. communis PSN243]|uniref:Uncharacterized protein n=1 Tax=Podospora aff. communis PSN243 TaxID=3040156 RepID=A0AAV9GQI1_9PEZI|nr:hypothetical protein QBC34DRAFT_297065 [Podospora aff. communis PSN243]